MKIIYIKTKNKQTKLRQNKKHILNIMGQQESPAMCTSLNHADSSHTGKGVSESGNSTLKSHRDAIHRY